MTNLLDRLIHPEERVVLFIDGANLYSAARGLQFDIDYKKLLDEFKKRGRLIRANYYTALLEDQDFSPIRPLIDWLDYTAIRLSPSLRANTRIPWAGAVSRATWTSRSAST